MIEAKLEASPSKLAQGDEEKGGEGSAFSDRTDRKLTGIDFQEKLRASHLLLGPIYTKMTYTSELPKVTIYGRSTVILVYSTTVSLHSYTSVQYHSDAPQLH